MKTLKYILLVALPLLLLSSKCKEKEPVIFVVKGRIMQSCTEPYSNVVVSIKGNVNLLGGTTTGASTTADENGYFRLEFEPHGGEYRLYAPDKILEFRQTTPEMDLGEVQVYGTVNFIIKLEVQNPYSNLDTLFIPDYNTLDPNAQIAITGPFTNGLILDTVYNRPFMSFPIRFGDVPEFTINYFFTPYNTLKFLRFQTPLCYSNFSEAVIKIE